MKGIIICILVGTAIAGLFVCAVSCEISPPVNWRQDQEIQELRQNIADLQNRVYELEAAGQ